MSGKCDSCGEHPVNCVCYSEKKYQDATIHIKKMFLDFLRYMNDHSDECNSCEDLYDLIDAFIEEFIIKENEEG